MLKTANDLSAYTLAAGEPFFLEVQFQDSTGAVLDLTERAFVLSFYRDDRSTEKAIDGEQLVDATGRVLRFARDGLFSEGLFGLNLMVELAERYLNGRSVVTQGRLTVERSAAGVPSFGNGIVAKFVTRITVRENAVLGGPPTFTQQQLRYRADAGAPPVTLGDVTLSGTLKVGVPSSGTIVGATTGSTVSESVVGLTVDSAARTYAYDGTGGAGTFPGGIVETHPNATNSGRASPVTIVAASSPGPITIDNAVARSGQQYTFTARRSTNLTQAETRSLKLAPSADYSPAATAAELADLTATASFAANSATAPVVFTVPTTIQPE